MTLAYKALFFDLSGVLYEGNRVIDGAAETITKAREKDLVLRFVTNTATKNSQTIIDGLHAMDIFIGEFPWISTGFNNITVIDTVASDFLVHTHHLPRMM